MEALGRTRWAIAADDIPSESSCSDRALASHETACIVSSPTFRSSCGIFGSRRAVVDRGVRGRVTAASSD